MKLITRFKEKAWTLKNEIPALYLAWKHPVTPWYSKLLLALAVGYALSPIDLIPDFIPFFGYLDDLVVLPVLTAMAIKFLPDEILEECRIMAENSSDIQKKNRIAALVIILIWIMILSALIHYIYQRSIRPD